MEKSIFFATGLSLLGAVCIAVLLSDSKPAPIYKAKPIPAWIEQLASDDYRTREEAAGVLHVLGSETTPWLIRALRQQDSIVRRVRPWLEQRLPFLRLKQRPPAALVRERVAEQLGLIAGNDPTVIHALICSLAETNRDVLSEIQRALRRAAPRCVPEMIEALSSRNCLLREGAAQVLLDLGHDVPEAIPALIRGLKDKDCVVRYRAAKALGFAEGGGANVISALSTALEDPTANVRMTAAESLGELGTVARPAAAALKQTLSDPDSEVRVSAAKALWQIQGNPAQVLPTLIGTLSEPATAWQTCFVLGEIGAPAAPAIPGLIEALKHEHIARPLRSPPSSVFALGRIGSVAVPALIPLLTDPRPWVRTGAALALGFIGESAKASVPALALRLKDKEIEVRQASALSLGTIDPLTRELAPALVELTRDEDIFVSSAALTALRKIEATVHQ